jgi:rhodanese-related sulfurtransferase
MIKTAIIYATKTRHSEKLAEAIGSSLNVKARNITGNPAVHDTGLLFIVGGIYGGVSMPLPKYTALVTSCASGRQRQAAVRGILEEKGIKVIDEFICRGSFLFVSIRHPNAKDLKEASDFALRIVKEVV